MRTVTISARSKALNDLLKQARAGNILLRSENGEQFVLAQVSSARAFYVGISGDFGEEIKATRANRKLKKFLDQRGQEVAKGKLVSMDDVEKKLGLGRKKR